MHYVKTEKRMRSIRKDDPKRNGLRYKLKATKIAEVLTKIPHAYKG